MFTKIHNAASNDTIFAVVRLNKEQHAGLKAYMSALQDSSTDIVFPYGAHLVKQGYGWYRLVARNEIRGVDKVMGALKIIKRWYAELLDAEDKARSEEIMRLMPAVLSQTHVVAHAAEGSYMYAGHNAETGALQMMPAEVKPADPQRLGFMASRLNAKYSSNHKSKRG